MKSKMNKNKNKNLKGNYENDFFLQKKIFEENNRDHPTQYVLLKSIKHTSKYNKNYKQAGAELCQTQVKLV
jgi:hypothetical protein